MGLTGDTLSCWRILLLEPFSSWILLDLKATLEEATCSRLGSLYADFMPRIHGKAVDLRQCPQGKQERHREGRMREEKKPKEGGVSGDIPDSA